MDLFILLHLRSGMAIEPPKRRGRPPGSKNKPRIAGNSVSQESATVTKKFMNSLLGWCLTDGHHQECPYEISCAVCACKCHK